MGTAGSAQSQGVYPPDAAMSPYPQAASMGGGPTGDFTGMAPPGGAYPSYYQPYPSISPYDQEYQRIANRGGIWESESQTRLGLPSRWKFRTEYVRMGAERGRSLIGNPNAPSYREQIAPTLTGAGGGGGGGGGAANLTSYINALRGTNGSSGFNLFDPVTAKELDSPMLQGLRLTLESENTDGSGVEMWGLWARDDDNTFNARDNVNPSRGTQLAFLELLISDPTLQTLTNPPANFPDVDMILQNNLLNLRGIPLDDGTVTTLADGTTFGGASAVYDLEFKIQTNLEIYGTGIRWKAMPLYKTDSFKLRPNAGVRYTTFRDQFGFYGRDSGILYDGQTTANQPPLPDVKIHSLPNNFDDNVDGIVDNAGLIEDSLGGAGGGGGGGANATMANFVFGDPLIFPLASTLNNNVQSHLAGPELGLSYDFGGEKGFRLGGSSNFGLLLNYQKIRLSGDNIFVTTRPADMISPTPTNATPNRFSSAANHSSVSPMFEQSVYGEGPLFQYIPILRRSAILRNANFRAAYTLTAIAEMTRASDSIVWQGNPSQGLFPSIQTSRSSFRTQSYNIGVTWSW
ncbi:MAG: hypothetical protein HQ518_12355 [Rhodopirellula sp.]|nr:hypothetical protein [Rhodopirellula sp.]